jgi:hypothetical protein
MMDLQKEKIMFKISKKPKFASLQKFPRKEKTQLLKLRIVLLFIFQTENTEYMI